MIALSVENVIVAMMTFVMIDFIVCLMWTGKLMVVLMLHERILISFKHVRF